MDILKFLIGDNVPKIINNNPGTINSILDGIESGLAPKELGRPEHNYDFIKKGINLDDYPKDENGHRYDAVKNDKHPTSPKRVKFKGKYLDITDFGLYSPEGINYILWGARDNGDGNIIPIYKDTGVIPEVTITPNGNYIKNTYDNIMYRKKGGTIHIKEKNRGKFTASAKRAGMGVQEYANKVLSDPNATPLQKRRANFARNAKKFKH